jgi:ribosomal protein L29
MEMKELKDKNEAELSKLLASTREKLRDMRFGVSVGKLKQVREIRQARQLIARILTIMKANTVASIKAKAVKK